MRTVLSLVHGAALVAGCSSGQDPAEEVPQSTAHASGTSPSQIEIAAGITLEVVAGTGERGTTGAAGPASEVAMDGPLGIAFGPDGDIYVSEEARISRIDAGTGRPGTGTDGTPVTAAQGGTLRGRDRTRRTSVRRRQRQPLGHRRRARRHHRDGRGQRGQRHLR